MVLLACVGFTLIYLVLHLIFSTFSPQARWLRAQPWVGRKNILFARLRAGFQSIFDTKSLMNEGYYKYAKAQKTFLLPQFGGRDLVMLPASAIREVIGRSDDEVDLLEMLNEILASDHLGTGDISNPNFQFDVIRHQLTRKLSLITKEVQDELTLAFKKYWGEAKRDEWTEVVAYPSIINIICRAANRAFCGSDLCRNQEFLDNLQHFAEGHVVFGQLINLSPTLLRPIVAFFLRYKLNSYMAACQRHAAPLVEQRLKEVRGEVEGEPSRDALTWLIEECLKREPKEHQPAQIARRLVSINMVAIHTTSITTTNTLFDLYAAPNADEIVASLREECESVLAKHGGEWSKAAVDELYQIDSVIKESMRYTTLNDLGLMRKVIKKDGLTLSQDVHIPAGVAVGVPMHPTHRDEDLYPHADEFDAFRFVKNRERQSEVLNKKSQGLVTTSESFLPFGHGRHACPGRFFASQEMKLTLAHVVMNYDIKLPGARPKGMFIKTTGQPDPKATLLIRLRG